MEGATGRSIPLPKRSFFAGPVTLYIHSPSESLSPFEKYIS